MQTILVVEDNNDIAVFLGDLLSLLGYDVVSVENGQQIICSNILGPLPFSRTLSCR